MSVPIKSVLRSLKKDLQRVALMAVEELGLFIVEWRAQLAELIMCRHPPTHVFCSTQRMLNQMPRSF